MGSGGGGERRRLKVLLEDSAVTGSAILPLKLSISVLDLGTCSERKLVQVLLRGEFSAM